MNNLRSIDFNWYSNRDISISIWWMNSTRWLHLNNSWVELTSRSTIVKTWLESMVFRYIYCSIILIQRDFEFQSRHVCGFHFIYKIHKIMTIDMKISTQNIHLIPLKCDRIYYSLISYTKKIEWRIIEHSIN